VNKKLPKFIQVSEDVTKALSLGHPIVALESTVITHGLPYPENKKLAEDMEAEVRRQSVTPATVAVVDGIIKIGVQSIELERLARGEDVHKISSRDLGPAIAHHWTGGTTVAGTIVAAHAAGIRVFATGGIGGVHRNVGNTHSARVSNDISADLPRLAQTPMVVVCAGAKAILDIPATLEYLETFGVPVIGFGTSDFPAFYARSSGLPASLRVDSPEEVVKIAQAHWELGLRSAVLVAVPPPETAALAEDLVESAVLQAILAAQSQGIRGQAVTPFLLSRMSELTHGASLDANLGLLRNNARLASEIALQFAKNKRLV
jgi:pseudouridine-5'-phosphate glycosidase